MLSTTKPVQKATAWLILSALALTWGSSFILMKKGLEVFSYKELGALRTAIAFLVLMPVFIPRLRRVSRRTLMILFISGICGSAAPAFLFSKAQTGIDSSLAGILNSLTPLFTLLLGMLISHYRPRWYNVMGLLAAFGGTVGLLHVSGDKGFSSNLSYAVYIIVATVLYALNINIIKYYLRDQDPLTITSGSFFTLGLPMLIYLFAFTPFTETMAMDPGAWEALGYVAILAVVATALALIAFNHLIKVSSILFASSVTYLIPLMALVWGVLDGEPFRLVFLLWISLILGGVVMVNRS